MQAGWARSRHDDVSTAALPTKKLSGRKNFPLRFAERSRPTSAIANTLPIVDKTAVFRSKCARSSRDAAGRLAVAICRLALIGAAAGSALHAIEAPLAAAESAPAPVAEPLRSAFVLVVGALIVGGLIAAVLLKLLWRNRPPRTTSAAEKRVVASRISDAAAGLPAPEEMQSWPPFKLRAVVAALAEVDGFRVQMTAGGRRADMALTPRNADKPAILVSCHASSEPATPETVAGLTGAMVADQVAVGWLVAPAGFTKEAVAAAEQAKLVVIDAEALLVQLRDLPAVLQQKVLSD